MGSRDILKNILSVLLLIVALTSGVMVVLVYESRKEAVNTSTILTITAAALMIIYTMINLVSGFFALSRRSLRRAGLVRPFIQIAVILAVLQIVVSAINGIYVGHFFVLLFSAIIIPEIVFVSLGLICS